MSIAGFDADEIAGSLRVSISTYMDWRWLTAARFSSTPVYAECVPEADIELVTSEQLGALVPGEEIGRPAGSESTLCSFTAV